VIPPSIEEIEAWGVQENAVNVRRRKIFCEASGDRWFWQKAIRGSWPARETGMREDVLASRKGTKVI
jgi:hypothetical protein